MGCSNPHPHCQVENTHLPNALHTHLFVLLRAKRTYLLCLLLSHPHHVTLHGSPICTSDMLRLSVKLRFSKKQLIWKIFNDDKSRRSSC